MPSRGNKQYRQHNVPPDEPWQWLPIELLRSVAWRLQSRRCQRLVEFLIVEHRSHAGFENGNLIATYDQLVDWGMNRKTINDAIAEAVYLGLVKVMVKGRGPRAPGGAQPSQYLLTFFPSSEFAPATNDWKRFDPREPTLCTSGRTIAGRDSGVERIRAWQKKQAASRKNCNWNSTQ